MTDAAKPIDVAHDRAQNIQQELEVAGAELHLTNSALGNLPGAAQRGDVARALEQNVAIEEKVNEAAEDLQAVTDLLKEEIAQRAWLEKELAIARAARR